MNNRFIYDEKTSALYAPDGKFLKVVNCPKAKHWNQLIVEAGEKRWRTCDECHENVIDLDVLDTEEAIKLVKSRWSATCIHASKNSDKVIFLRDVNGIPDVELCEIDAEKRIVIKTVRTIDDINRAAAMGYTVDIRRVFYETQKLRCKMTIGQDPRSGRIETSGDYRNSFRDPSDGAKSKSRYREIFPFFSFYQYFQPVPVAAYLIPKGASDGMQVIIEDPIEDFVGSRWNQGDQSRAKNIVGHIENSKVVIDDSNVEVIDFIG